MALSDPTPVGGAWLWLTFATVDADGDPRAYAPPGAGLAPTDYLGNGHANPRNLSSAWIAGPKDPRDPSRGILQGPDEPAPGYYVSANRLQNPEFPVEDQRRYADASSVPFVAMGQAALARCDAAIGDLMWLVNIATLDQCPAIVGDSSGKGSKAHEISPAACDRLGLPSSPRNGGTDRDVIAYLLFPGSGEGGRWPVDFEGRAADLFVGWGGASSLAGALGLDAIEALGDPRSFTDAPPATASAIGIGLVVALLLLLVARGGA